MHRHSSSSLIKTIVSVCLLVFSLGVAGEVFAAGKAIYEVRRGDSLIRIARRLGITLGELQGDNSLQSDLIVVGQKLDIQRPFHKHTEKADLKWGRPVPHFESILLGFGSQKNGQGVNIPHTGINVAVANGTSILAPADGVVRYVGEQDGFGTLAIIMHAAGYSTVLAPLDPRRIKVEVGQVVLRGDVLGPAGDPVEHDRRYVHIELRHDNDAIKPGRLLR